MGLFRSRKARQTTVQSVAKRSKDVYPGDWITVPFRFVEAVRVSMHTIGAQPEVSPEIRLWIAEWLRTYNAHLVMYMKEYYGPHVLPLLDQITKDVMPDDPEGLADTNLGDTENTSGEPWEHWESQFREGGDGREH